MRVSVGQSFRFAVFVLCFLWLNWIGMILAHESGHVLGAFATGAGILAINWSPLSIPTTSISPNPSPLVVVWLGPILGTLIPLVVWLIGHSQAKRCKAILLFWLGFCCIANGAYIGIGSIQLIGDCFEMSRSGTPRAIMAVWGIGVAALGLWCWHCLGPPLRILSATWIYSFRALLVMSSFALMATTGLWFLG